jgi:hypothetical protein
MNTSIASVRQGRAPKKKEDNNKTSSSSSKSTSTSNASTEAPTIVKKERLDRSEKLKARHTLELTVVKSALRRYIKHSNTFVNAMVDAIADRVRVVSRKTVDMSIGFAGWIKEQFDGRPNLVAVQLDGIFEQTFFQQFMLGVEDAQLPDARILDFHERHPGLRPSAERHPGDRNLYSSASKRYLTNFKNALRTNVDNRIRGFVGRYKDLHQLSSTESFTMLYELCGWRLPPRTDRGALPMRREVYETIQEHRRILELGEDGQYNKLWLRSNECLEPLLRYNILLNRFYERHGLKLFNVVPICQIKSHFVTIDTYVLYGILKEIGFIECNETAFVASKERSWYALFKISQLQGNGCTFGCSLETDGISMCLHFERPKEVSSNEFLLSDRDVEAAQFNPGPQDVVLGCDPGRINIYYMAAVLPDGSIRTFVLTRKQYYHDAGINGAKRHAERWNLGIKTHLEALSTVSSKGTNLQTHAAYLLVYYQHREALWAEYTRPRWARQRLTLYGGKKRVFSKFFNHLENEIEKAAPGSNVVIAYGAAKFAPGGRGELSVPTSRAHKECVSRVNTKVTAEFRSSKVDYQDDSVLQNIAVVSQPKFALRGVLWNVARGEFVSRDLNAALNIRRYLLHRPAILNRRLATGKLQQQIVKRIQPR